MHVILQLKNIYILLSSIVTAIFSSCPAFVAVLSFVILKEKMNVLKILSILLSIGGILIISLN